MSDKFMKRRALNYDKRKQDEDTFRVEESNRKNDSREIIGQRKLESWSVYTPVPIIRRISSKISSQTIHVPRVYILPKQ